MYDGPNRKWRKIKEKGVDAAIVCVVSLFRHSDWDIYGSSSRTLNFGLPQSYEPTLLYSKKSLVCILLDNFIYIPNMSCFIA